MEPVAPKLILVPTDFSAPSAQALRYGAALAERYSAHREGFAAPEIGATAVVPRRSGRPPDIDGHLGRRRSIFDHLEGVPRHDHVVPADVDPKLAGLRESMAERFQSLEGAAVGVRAFESPPIQHPVLLMEP